MAAITVKPNEVVPVSGMYRHSCGAAGQSTLIKGHRAPATHSHGDVWVLAQATPHVG
jgi:hypothetical protein